MDSEISSGNPNLSTHLNELGKQLLEKAKNGESDEVRALMSAGAPLATDWLGTSPLHMAAASGHVDTCEILLRAGCSRDAHTKVDKTPLHLAAYEGHEEVVDLLLRYGASIDAKDMLLMTPLHWAVEKGHLEVARTLLQRGASIDLVSKFDLTPMDIATQAERKDVVELLQTYLVSPKAIDSAVASLFSPNTNVPIAASSDKGPVTVSIGPKVAPRKVGLNGRATIKITGQRVISSNKTSPTCRSLRDPILSDLEVLEQAACNGQVSEDALQYLHNQGINVQDSALQDDGSLVTAALESGQTITLSDAGRLALGRTDPGRILIVGSSDAEERIKLQQQLQQVRQEAEAYKKALAEKAKEADEYKKRLNLADPEHILGDPSDSF